MLCDKPIIRRASVDDPLMAIRGCVRQAMDGINFFLNDMNIPQELRVRVREYMRSTKELTKHASYNELVEQVSPTLRGELVLHMSEKVINNNTYVTFVAYSHALHTSHTSPTLHALQTDRTAHTRALHIGTRASCCVAYFPYVAHVTVANAALVHTLQTLHT